MHYKKFDDGVLVLKILLLYLTTALGDNENLNCREFGVSRLACTSVQWKSADCKGCALDLCSYLYPKMDCNKLLQECETLDYDCQNQLANSDNVEKSKKALINKHISYLLFKLHPYMKQTSQLGFLTSGRFRRITGITGTELLGKRSRNGRGLHMNVQPGLLAKKDNLSVGLVPSGRVVQGQKEEPSFRTYIRRNGNFGTELLGKRKPEFGNEGDGQYIARGKDPIVGGGGLKFEENPETFILGSELFTDFGKDIMKKNKLQKTKTPKNEMPWRRHTGNELLGKKSQEPNTQLRMAAEPAFESEIPDGSSAFQETYS